MNFSTTKINHCATCNKEFFGYRYCSPECKPSRAERKKAQALSLKLELIALRGGRCSGCKKEYEVTCLCFHHRSDKLFTIDQNTLVRFPRELVLKEAEKCDLLCHNCHALHHFAGRKATKTTNKASLAKSNKGYERKRELIRLKGGRCEDCGHSSYETVVFSFDHISPDKSFELNAARLASKSWESILKELEKCRLLCLNCHMSKNKFKNRLNGDNAASQINRGFYSKNNQIKRRNRKNIRNSLTPRENVVS